MSQHPARLPRVEILDPLRALAALAVAWFHFTLGGPLLDDGWLKSSGTYGWLGVEVFFVISGFVLPLSLHRGGYRLRPHLLTFLLKRIVRLDPPYIITIAITVALAYASAMAPGYAGEPPRFTWVNVLLHLGYLNAFVGQPWINVVFWTLAVEFQFYVLIALLFRPLARVPRGFRGAAAVLIGSAAFLWPDPAYVVHYLPLFALGIATFDLFTERTGRVEFGLTAAALTTIGGVAMGWPMALAGIATAVCIAFVRVRVPRPFVWLGALSYSLYLLHVPIGGRVINFGARWADSLPEHVVVLALALAVSLAASYLMYRFVEEPSQRLSSSISYRKAPAATREPAVEPASAPVPAGVEATPLADPRAG